MTKHGTGLKEDKETDFLDPANAWRRLFAEFLGTFFLVMVSAGGSMVEDQFGQVSKGMQALAGGLIVMSLIYSIGETSGAHINPVVTLAFALRRHFPWKRVPVYIGVQLIGGIASVLFLKFSIGPEGKLGATIPDADVSTFKAFLIETVLTMGLIITILGTASGPKNVGNNGAIAIGGYIAVAGLWASPLTGASMNIARSFAPDLIRGEYNTSWIYIAGPVAGAILAVGFEWLLKGKPSEKATEEAQGKQKE